ncbi:MAG: sigma-70 family RNA polymerase sigma factor [Myxococcales bacterium]
MAPPLTSRAPSDFGLRADPSAASAGMSGREQDDKARVRQVEAVESSEGLDTAAVFRRYAPYVAKVGLRILGRRDELDDFVQDVFVTVHRKLDSLRDVAALKHWLATLAVHEATRRLRRRKLRALLGMGSVPDYADAADASASPEQRALLAQVFLALEALPADEHVAWSLRYIEGETMERVAELCACSLSTAKRRVAGAEKALEKRGLSHV